jgi:poly(A) polymerase
MLESLENPRFELALAATLREMAFDRTAAEAAALVDAICRRLRLSNDELDDVAWLVGHRGGLQEAGTWPTYRLKRLLAKPLIHELLALERTHAAAASASPVDIDFCAGYLCTTGKADIDPPPLITGNDLVAAGLEPGAKFKELLENVRDAQLNGEIKTREEALAFVRRLLGGG